MKHGQFDKKGILPESPFYQGPFGRITRGLDPWAPDVEPSQHMAHFLKFANDHMVEQKTKQPTQLALEEKAGDLSEKKFETDIPAGYTYFGQFIDHDITLDITPLSESKVDPNKLTNFRTPRLDLDCIYGSGPDDQPYMYEHGEDGKITGRMHLGKIENSKHKKKATFDLPRNKEGRAIIGDMRNDENAIVCQIQLAFLKAHNKLVDIQGDEVKGSEKFKRARQSLVWLYQYIVWKDFLNRMITPDVLSEALRHNKKTNMWELGLSHIYNWKKQPFIPVEFSVAAYRFGHSLARNAYQTNNANVAGFNKFFPLFDVHNDDKESDLSGFRPLKDNRVIQWDWFLEMGNGADFFPQRTRKIDTKLSNALLALREDKDKKSFLNILPARNLLRSVNMALPSGTDTAEFFGIEDTITLNDGEPDALWFYILKEASEQNNGNKLGELGGKIVASVFAGLLKGDPHSWINIKPNWSPDKDPLISLANKDDVLTIDETDAENEQEKEIKNPRWSLASIIRLGDMPISGADFDGE